MTTEFKLHDDSSHWVGYIDDLGIQGEYQVFRLVNYFGHDLWFLAGIRAPLEQFDFVSITRAGLYLTSRDGLYVNDWVSTCLKIARPVAR